MILLEIASKPEVTNPIWDMICTWQFWVFGLPFLVLCIYILIAMFIVGSQPPRGVLWTGSSFNSYDPDKERTDDEEDDHLTFGETDG